MQLFAEARGVPGDRTPKPRILRVSAMCEAHPLCSHITSSSITRQASVTVAFCQQLQAKEEGACVCKGEFALSPLGHKGNFSSDCPAPGAPAENPTGADSPKLQRISQSEGKTQQGSEQQGEEEMGEYCCGVPARRPASG